jgi:hypothetical protein
MTAYVPPGWPSGVHPPGSEDFERTAHAWLLDAVPPDYRLHGVLRRYPLALAAMAAHHAKACVAGARTGYRTARTELGEALPPHALEAVLAAYRAEGRRLVATAQAVDLVARALRGEVFTPQLQESSAPGARPGPPGPRAAPDGLRPGTGPDSEDRLSAGRAARGAEDQLGARRAAMSRGTTGDQPGTRRAAASGSPRDQVGARLPAAAPGQTGAQPGAGPVAAPPGTPDDQLGARRTSDGPVKTRKAPAAQPPAHSGGATRRKTRPTDEHAAAG